MCFIVVRTRIGHSLRCLLNVRPMRDSISQWKKPDMNGPGRLYDVGLSGSESGYGVSVGEASLNNNMSGQGSSLGEHRAAAFIRRTWGTFDVLSCVLSIVISLLSNTGTRFVRYQSLHIAGPADAAVLVVKIVLYASALYLVIRALVSFWDRPAHDRTGSASAPARSPILSIRLSDRSMYLACFLIMMAAWLLWVIPHLPGTMRDDSIPQYLQYFGYVDYYTQHPIFDTLCFGIFWDMGTALGSPLIGLSIYIIVQCALTAACFSLLLVYLRRRGVPDAALVIFLVFYSFARVVYQPVDAMSKDSWNGWSFVLSMICVVEIARTRGACLQRRLYLIGTIVSIFICIASKRTMLYVLTPTLVLFALTQIRGKRSWAARTFAAGTVPALAFLLIWNPLSVAMFGATQNTTYEMLSVPVQQVVYTVKENPSALSAGERRELSEYIQIDRAVQVYNPWRSDEATGCIYPDGDVRTLVKYWIELGLEHPDDYLTSFMNIAGQWFSLDIPINYGHDLEDELLTDARMEGWASFFPEGGKREAESVLQVFRSERPEPLQRPYEALERIDSIQAFHLPVLSSYGLYAFVIPITVAAWSIARRNLMSLGMSLVPLLLLCTFLIGPIALYWYTVPIVYIAPLMLSFPLLSDRGN